MIDRNPAQSLIENAVSEVEQAAEVVFRDELTLPFTSQTDLLFLALDDRALVRRSEESSYPERPTLSALNFCLESCLSLLAVAHSLLDRPQASSPLERERLWKTLAEDTKLAGEAAQKAVLVLSDPAAHSVGPQGAGLAPSVASDDRQKEFAQREQVLQKSSFYRHWNRIKSENITASQFIEFLRPLADLDGICVSYIYKGENGDEKIYNHGKESSSKNPLADAIKRKELTREKALTFALNEEGRVWIESNFLEL